MKPKRSAVGWVSNILAKVIKGIAAWQPDPNRKGPGSESVWSSGEDKGPKKPGGGS